MRIVTFGTPGLLLAAVGLAWGAGGGPVKTDTGPGGRLEPLSPAAAPGSVARFAVRPDDGFVVERISGCGGKLEGATYTTAPVEAACRIEATFALADGAKPLGMDVQSRKLVFRWPAVRGTLVYRLYQNQGGDAGFVRLNQVIGRTELSQPVSVHTHDWAGSRYRLDACNAVACVPLNEVGTTLADALEAIEYIKAPDAQKGDWFGYSAALSGDGAILAVGAKEAGAVYLFTEHGVDSVKLGDGLGASVALSRDGRTLAVGAVDDSSGETGAHREPADDKGAPLSGAVYVYTIAEGKMHRQAYIKASNPEEMDVFGYAVALSADGNTLAVGATFEDSGIGGIDEDPHDNSADAAGAVYVFTREDGRWRQQAYIKAANATKGAMFGNSLALSDDGDTLAVGADGEHGGAAGGTGPKENLAYAYGAAYVFSRRKGKWSQNAYLKLPRDVADASVGSSIALSGDGRILAVSAPFPRSLEPKEGSGNYVAVFTRKDAGWSKPTYVTSRYLDPVDSFGSSVALSGDGRWLAVGTPGDDSRGPGLAGDESDNSVKDAGAVYLFARDGADWKKVRYVKASNTQKLAAFGDVVALDGTGKRLAVGAPDEGTPPMEKNSLYWSGAVYLY